MPTIQDYAVLSSLVYNDVRIDLNQVAAPQTDGWKQIDYVSDIGWLGFTAGAYQNSGGDIVISFKGTDTDTVLNEGTDWLGGNIPAGFGFGSPQIIQAALFYERIKTQAEAQAIASGKPPPNITFTGHSLGGGLASLMAVFFNRPATTFDEAPFLLSALNPAVVAGVEAALIVNGFNDTSLATYLLSIPVSFALRQPNVTDYFVSGEVLSYFRNTISTIYGADKPIDVGASLLAGSGTGNAITLHSIILLSALEISKRFQSDTLLLSNLLPAIFDGSLYYRNPFKSDPDFLSQLLNDQIKLGYNNANAKGLLVQFASDIARIIGGGGLAILNDTLDKALIATVIEDYYYMANGFTKAFFADAGNGISFNLNDINSSTDATGIIKMDAAMQSILGQDSAKLVTGDLSYQWYIDGTNGAMSASSSDTLPALMIGSNGDDSIHGGSGNDILFGGLGNDSLYGGAGTDTYIFKTGDGQDTIIDSDGKGKIYENGAQITGTKVKSTNDGSNTLWSDGNTQYKFTPNDTVSATGIGTLTITTGSDTITIKNFDLSKAQSDPTNGYLGISFNKSLVIAAGTSGLAPVGQGDQTTDVAIGNTKTFTIYASTISATAQTIQLTLAGGGSYALSTGSTQTPFNGSTSVTIAAGQDSATFTLIDLSNAHQVDTATLTASVIDANGTVKSNNLTVTFDNPAAEPSTAPTNPVDGQLILARDSGLSFDYTKYAGNGLINTGNGINYVVGGSLINGGGGQDVIRVGDGNNVINGAGGQEVIFAGNGNNQIYANKQTDLATALTARSATATGLIGDLIAVGDGNNTIVGGNGNDVISTGTGNNMLVLGSGANIVSGGSHSGFLTLTASLNWDAVTYINFPDAETLYQGFRHISTGFTAPANYHGNYVNDIPNGIGNDTIFGGSGDSVYWLSNGDNYLDAGGGNDYILAGIGNNTIFGGKGNDVIWGSGGNNFINTESGNDWIVAEGGNNTIIGGTGNDTIYSGDNGSDWASSEIMANNYIYGGAGDSLIYGSGGNDTLIGGTGNTTIYGGAGNEYIVGGDGNAYLVGGDGNDTIYAGGNGNDTIFAGNGHNTIYGGNGTDIIKGGSGTDFIMAGDGGTVDAPTILYAGSGTGILYGGTGVDRLIGGSGSDTLIAGTGTSTLQGGTGTEVMYSSIGNATLIAGSGSDTLYGGGGTDWLQGSSGNTVFVAGSGNETIVGGTGNNTYQFNAGFGNIEVAKSTKSDTFQFGPGISLANMTVSVTAGVDGNPALLIQTSDGGSLTINDASNSTISQFTFTGGSPQTLGQLIADFTDPGQALSGFWTNPDGASVTSSISTDGTSALTTVQLDGSSTALAGDGKGDYLKNYFSTTGQLIGDSYTNADGSYGNDTIINALNVLKVGTENYADGSYSTDKVILNNYSQVETDTTYFNASAVETGYSTSIQDNSGTTTVNYNAAGNITSTSIDYLDGSHIVTTYGSNGGYITDNYNTAGLLTSDSYSKANGTSGSDMFNPDGSGTGSANYFDGSYGTYQFFKNGNNQLETDTTYFNAGGVEIGYSVTIKNSQTTNTVTQYSVAGALISTTINTMDAAGTLVSDTWTKPDASYGSDTYNADGSYSTTVNDGNSNATSYNYGTSENLLSDSYTKADGTYGNDTFNADGSSSGTSQHPDGSYSMYVNDGLGTVTTDYYDVTGALTSYSIAIDNGLNDVTTDTYTPAGFLTNDTYTKVDGTYGSDTFNADGSSTGITHHPDGSYSTVTNDGKGNVTTDYYSSAGALTGYGITTTDSQGNVTTNNYTPSGGVTGYSISINDGNGDVTTNTYTYTSAGVVTSVLYANRDNQYLPYTTTKGYDTSGLWTDFKFSFGVATSDSDSGSPASYTVFNNYNASGISGLNGTIHANQVGLYYYDIAIQNANGSSSDINSFADGRFIHTYLDDGHGNTTRYTYFSQGVLQLDDWTKADGTYGSDVFNPTLGSGTNPYGSSYNPDGSFTHYQYDANGVATIDSFNAAGELIGETYSGASTLTGDSYANSGSLYQYAASYSARSKTPILDNTINVNNLGSPGGYNTNVNLPTSSKYYNLDGSYTIYDSNSRNRDGYTATGILTTVNLNSRTALQRSWVNSDGSESSVVSDGLIGSSNGITYRADGSYTTTVNDGIGNVTSVSYTSAGDLIGDIWSKENGSRGNDTYNSDGSMSGISNNLDGSYSLNTNDGAGHGEISNYDAAGILTGYSTSTNNGQGSITTDNYTATGILINYSVSTIDSQGGLSTNNYTATGVLLTGTWSITDGEFGSVTYNADGSSSGTGLSPDGSYYTYTDNGHGLYNQLNYDTSGKLTDTYTSTNDGQGTTSSTDYNAVTGEVAGSNTTAGVGYSYTYDNTNLGSGVTESKVTYTYTDGSTYSTDTVSDPNGSYQQSWVKSDGSSASTDYNAVTGEVIGSNVTAGAGYSYTYDNTNLGSGITESKVTYTYTDGSTYSTDTVSDPNGSYQQSWVKSDGSSASTDYNATTGEVIGSNATAGAGYSYTYDNTKLSDGSSESKVTYTYTDGSIYATDTVNHSDGSYQQSWSKSDGSHASTDYNATTGEVIGSNTTAGVGYSYTYDNTQLGHGITESKVAYTYTDGSTYSTDTVSNPNGSYQQSWVKSDGSSASTDYNAITGEVIGSNATAGAGYSYTYDNTNLGSGVTESKVAYTYADGSTYSTDTVSDPNGSYQQSWVKSDGSSASTDYNAVTGEVIGSNATAGAGYSYSYDNTNLGSGITESKVAYTYIDGSTYSTDTVSDPNGSYQQSWVKSDGSSASTNYNAVTGEVIGSNSTAGAGYSYTYDNTKLSDGSSESKVTYTYTDGSTYATDTVSHPDGAYFQSWAKSDGTAASVAVSANGTVTGDSTVAADGSQTVDASGNHVFMGSAANDSLAGQSGNNLLIGGIGNDTITTGSGSNVIAFNQGDCQDSINAVSGQNNTVSLGGHFAYADLALQKNGTDLVLDIGSSDSMTFKGWYAGNSNIVNLQVIASAMSDFNPGSTDILRNSQVETFDFQQIVSAFDQAQTANPSSNPWSVSNTLLDAHLSSSDSAALGGDLANIYGARGNLSGFGVSAAEGQLSSSQFAAAAQTLNPWPTLNTGTAQIR